MNIEKCLEKYSSEYYKKMFGLHPEISDEISFRKAEQFLKKFAMDETSFFSECIPAMSKIFRPDGYKGFDVSKMSFKKIFQDGVTMFSYISSPLFWDESLSYIKEIAKASDDKYLFIIENEECEEQEDVAFKLKIPTNISWEELSGGGFVSDVVFNMFHNDYLVFGEKGNWGRWCDYDNDWVDYEVFGYNTNSLAIQNYRNWCSLDNDISKTEMPNEVKRYLV